MNGAVIGQVLPAYGTHYRKALSVPQLTAGLGSLKLPISGLGFLRLPIILLMIFVFFIRILMEEQKKFISRMYRKKLWFFLSFCLKRMGSVFVSVHSVESLSSYLRVFFVVLLIAACD